MLIISYFGGRGGGGGGGRIICTVFAGEFVKMANAKPSVSRR